MVARVRKTIGLGLVLLVVASLLSSLPALAEPQPPSADPPLSAAAPAPQASVTIELCASAGSVTMPDGAVVPIWGFSELTGGGCAPAQLPGPLLDVNAGDVVTVSVFNDLGENVSLVFPGQNMAPDVNGVAPGGAASYTFTAGEPGTFLYESGTNPAIQVPMGLYGPLVVRPATANRAYDGPAPVSEYEYDSEAILLLSEIDPVFNSSPTSANLLNYAPMYWLINGKAYPDTAAITAGSGERVLLRYLNAGSINHTMTMLGLHQRLVAMDGYPLLYPVTLVAQTIPSGQTMDMVTTVPAGAAVGATFPLYNRQLHLTNVAAFPGGMMTFISVQAAGAAAPANGADGNREPDTGPGPDVPTPTPVPAPPGEPEPEPVPAGSPGN